jgi:MFS family permease
MWDDNRVMLFKFSAYGFLKNLRFFEPFLYLFFLANGLSYLQIGILISIREISVNLLEIPTGIVADMTGRRRAMAIAFASYMASFSAFYLFSGFYPFIPAMVLFALGETFRSGTHKSMIMTHLDREEMSDRKVEYYGKTRSASRLGSALSALIAALIVFQWQDYNVVFLATLVPYTLGFLLMFTYPSELDGQIAKRTSLSEVRTHISNSISQLRHSPGLARMLANSSIYDSFFTISKDYLSPIVKRYAVMLPVLLYIGNVEERTAIMVGIVYFFVYMCSFVASRRSYALLRRVGNMATALNVLYLVLAVSFLLIAVSLGMGWVMVSIAGFFLLFILYNIRKPMVVGYLGDRIQPQTRATLLSTQNQTVSVVGIFIAPALGYLADAYGIAYTFGFGALVLLVSGLILPIRDETVPGGKPGPGAAEKSIE